MPNKSKEKKTTISVTQSNADALRKLIHGREDYDNVISRLLQNIADVYVDFIEIDGELPQLHTAVIQLGEDKHSLYYYDGNSIEPTTLIDANMLLGKQRKMIGLTPNEVKKILSFLPKGLAQIHMDDQDTKLIFEKLGAFVDDGCEE